MKTISQTRLTLRNSHPHIALDEKARIPRLPWLCGVRDSNLKIAEELESKVTRTSKIYRDCSGRKPHTWTKILFNSIYATFLPKHCHFPYPKTISTFSSLSRISSGVPSSQRSGRNTHASGPQIFSFLIMPNTDQPIFVFSGM